MFIDRNNANLFFLNLLFCANIVNEIQFVQSAIDNGNFICVEIMNWDRFCMFIVCTIKSFNQ